MAQTQDIKPAYEVHHFAGTTMRTMYEFDKEKRVIVPREGEADGGFMIDFTNSHSISA